MVAVTSFLIFQDTIQCIVTQYFGCFDVIWEHLKKQLNKNNERLKNTKNILRYPQPTIMSKEKQ